MEKPKNFSDRRVSKDEPQCRCFDPSHHKTHRPAIATKQAAPGAQKPGGQHGR